MTLGQTIMRLRAQNGWSQDELAAKLDVSRQSVSKWETDGSVPELEKLLKLSEVFGVTLDALARGEETAAGQTAPETPASAEPKRHTTAGVILLCSGAIVFFLFLLLGGGLSGLLYALPFWLPALVCFTVRRHAGLWCAWAVFVSVDLYLRYATGLNWSVVRQTLIWEKEWNYTRLFVAWCQFAGMAAMLVCTLRAYRGKVVELTKRFAWKLGVGWAVYLAALPYLSRFVLMPLRGKLPGFGAGGWTLWFLLDVAYSYLRLALLIALLHGTLAAYRAYRMRGREQI